MNSYIKTTLGAALALIVAAGVVCPSLAESGLLKIKGSDTVLPLSSALAEAYMKKHPDAVISVTGGGSGVGFASLINGACQIANASRESTPKEIALARDRNKVLKATTIAKDGVAIIVHPSNPVKDLSRASITKLFTTAGSWKDVGVDGGKVVAVGRDSSSGTYLFFQMDVLGGKRFRPETLTLPSNTAICQAVSQDRGAIGYVGLPFAKEAAAKGKVRIVPVNGVPASDATVSSGKYPLWRPLYCYTNGRPGGIIGDFLKFATSPEGQKIVEEQGYVPR